VYSDPRVIELIDTHFVPVRAHVKEQHAAFQELGQRFGAQWTPTTIIIDREGIERHRIEGFLPADDYLAQLHLGLGHAAFAASEFAEAERHFSWVLDHFPDGDAAPEALYWAGVARYKATNDPAALAETAAAFRTQHTDTSWAKKASVWG